MYLTTKVADVFLPIDCSQILLMFAYRGIWKLVFGPFSLPTLTMQSRDIKQLPAVTHSLSPMTTCPLSLGVSAPFPADLFQNVSFSSRLCCLFYRSLSLCCERLRLLVLEVNLTNLWISPISFGLVFFPFSYLFYSQYFDRFSPPVQCFVFASLQEQCFFLNGYNQLTLAVLYLWWVLRALTTCSNAFDV